MHITCNHSRYTNTKSIGDELSAFLHGKIGAVFNFRNRRPNFDFSILEYACTKCAEIWSGNSQDIP